MIALALKQQNSTEAAAHSLSSKDEKPTSSFASLLHSVQDPKTDKKQLSHGLLLALDNTKETPLSKKEKQINKSDIFALLKSQKIQKSEETKELDDFAQLNPKLTASMSITELKTLILKAKRYIKSQITQSEGFKKQEIASLPKTLKGLTQVAKKIGIDISKITLETVQEVPQRKIHDFKRSALPDFQSDAKDVKSGEKVKDFKTSALPDFQSDTTDVKSAKNIVPKTENVEKVKDLKRSFAKKENTLPKETPLFQAEKQKTITTQELVEVKSLHHENVPKEKKKVQTLESLLHGEKVSHNGDKKVNLMPDASVSTTKMVTPQENLKVTKKLESLLKNSEHEESHIHHKMEMTPLLKADSFEVKIHEAKDMVKYLSHDVKNAIDEYKSPFTRLKVQLNPQKLGEIDLTIVQRGKNLHVNLSSNNAAINTLAMNVNDLKMQLSNNGINNATFNFNSNSQSSDGSFGSQTQQQQQQQRERAQSEYSYTQQQERAEEVLSSLEIVVPHYA